jgi:pimeloyl-ACP methyl ester carboxylesterase
MNKKKMILIVLLICLILLNSWMLIDYNNWRNGTISRLQETSSLVETTQGMIEYTINGEGPVVLLIHGTPGGYDQGDLVSKIFNNEEMRFVSVSRPGYLRTPLSVGKTPEEQADAYIAFLNELQIERVFILAISGGGPSALQFALRHPDRCNGLILVSAITESPEPITLSPIQQGFQSMMEKVLTSDFGNWILYKLLHTFPSAAVPQDPEAFLEDEEQQQLFLDLYNTLFPGSLRIEGINNDTEQYTRMAKFPFSEILVPTLILHGTSDRNVPFETAAFAAENIPNAQLYKMEAGVHEFFLVRKRQEEFVSIVITFIKDHVPPN